VKCWENERRNNTNTVLWLPSEKYVVILSRRKNYYALVTAFVHRERNYIKYERESRESFDPRPTKS
jgi:hypothetical protein